MAPTRVKDDNDTFTTMPGTVSVPKYAYPPIASMTADPREFSPGFSVMAPTRVNDAKDTFTTMPGVVYVQKYAYLPIVSITAE
jgi:hypothetical protein